MEFALYSSGRGVVDTDCFFIKIGLRCGVTRTAFFVAGRSATRWLRVEDVCPLHFESDRYAAVECSIISPQATPAVSPDDSAMRFLFRTVIPARSTKSGDKNAPYFKTPQIHRDKQATLLWRNFLRPLFGGCAMALVCQSESLLHKKASLTSLVRLALWLYVEKDYFTITFVALLPVRTM